MVIYEVCKSMRVESGENAYTGTFEVTIISHLYCDK